MKPKHRIELLFSLALIACSLMFLFPIDSIFFKKLAEYANHWLFVCLAVGIICLAVNWIFGMYSAFISAGLLSFFLMNSFNTNLKLASEKNVPAFTAVYTNISLAETSPLDFLQALLSQNADIYFIEELTPDWQPYLDKIFTAKYPYNITQARIDPLGKAIYSKFPLVHKDTADLNQIPVLSTQMVLHADTIQIIQTNYLPPLTMNSYQRLKSFLDILSHFTSKVQYPVLCAANFNIVPWSQELRNFKSQGNLNSSKRDNLATGLSDFLNVPYNEIFYSNGLECTQFEAIKDEQSRSLGVLGKYQVKIKGFF